MQSLIPTSQPRSFEGILGWSYGSFPCSQNCMLIFSLSNPFIIPSIAKYFPSDVCKYWYTPIDNDVEHSTARSRGCGHD
jgi:hypothetical protein